MTDVAADTLLALDGRVLGKNTEVEFKSDAPMGFDVELVTIEGKHRFFHNVCELHWAYPTPLPNRSCAIESDVHQTGITVDLHTIRSVFCRPPACEHESFHG